MRGPVTRPRDVESRALFRELCTILSNEVIAPSSITPARKIKRVSINSLPRLRPTKYEMSAVRKYADLPDVVGVEQPFSR